MARRSVSPAQAGVRVPARAFVNFQAFVQAYIGAAGKGAVTSETCSVNGGIDRASVS